MRFSSTSTPYAVAGYVFVHHASGPVDVPVVPGQQGISGQLLAPTAATSSPSSRTDEPPPQRPAAVVVHGRAGAGLRRRRCPRLARRAAPSYRPLCASCAPVVEERQGCADQHDHRDDADESDAGRDQDRDDRRQDAERDIQAKRALAAARGRLRAPSPRSQRRAGRSRPDRAAARKVGVIRGARRRAGWAVSDRHRSRRGTARSTRGSAAVACGRAG